MPRIIIAAKRYAQAIFQIASERGELERWERDLEKLKDTLLRPALIYILESPKFSLKEKTLVLKEVLGDINPMVLNLAGVLISRGRARLIGSIVDEYKKLLLKYYGIEPIEVITAIPLDSDRKGFIEERLPQILGMKLKLDYRVDPEILGGIIVRGEDWIFDGSVRGKLVGLRKNLLTTGG